MARVQIEVPPLIHDALDHPDALVVLSFDACGMLAILSDRQDPNLRGTDGRSAIR